MPGRSAASAATSGLVAGIEAPPPAGQTWSLMPESVYIQISLETNNDSGKHGFGNSRAMEEIISRALLDAFGIAGSASIVYELVEFDEATGAAVLGIPVDQSSKLWAALTMISMVHGRPARISVSRASPFLYALSRVAIPPP
jgi:RNase P/RNase MRP subunit POP5